MPLTDEQAPQPQTSAMTAPYIMLKTLGHKVEQWLSKPQFKTLSPEERGLFVNPDDKSVLHNTTVSEDGGKTTIQVIKKWDSTQDHEKDVPNYLLIVPTTYADGTLDKNSALYAADLALDLRVLRTNINFHPGMSLDSIVGSENQKQSIKDSIILRSWGAPIVATPTEEQEVQKKPSRLASTLQSIRNTLAKMREKKVPKDTLLSTSTITPDYTKSM